MLFSSPVFIFVFLPVSLLLYWVLGQKNVVLLLLSLLFYAWGEPVLVLVMLGTILINYVFGIGLDRARARGPLPARAVLTVGLAINICILGFYKYLDFLIAALNPFIEALGWTALAPQHLPLPLGVSFFTFQAMSYLIDIYRNAYGAQRDIVKFALFKTLYPQLIAGPIVRYSELAHQLKQRSMKVVLFADGVRMFITGLAKKVLIADVVAVSVDRIFALPHDELSASLAWAGAGLFMIQIYFDFSGYTDMARGLCKMLGFRIPPNFNFPYAALSIQDFWRRWHMTLSRWFRDYLYIPLGGNRKGNARTAFNRVMVFCLCGLWHGANLTFIVWGLYHGLFLALERTQFGAWVQAWPTFMRRLYVLLVLIIGWMIFRAQSMEQVDAFAHAMLGLNGLTNPLHHLRVYADSLTLIAAVCGAIASFPLAKTMNLRGWYATVLRTRPIATAASTTLVYGVTLLVCFAFIGAQTHRAFIYFRF